MIESYSTQVYIVFYMKFFSNLLSLSLNLISNVKTKDWNVKFDIVVESNFKYPTKDREVKFDIGTNEIRDVCKKIYKDSFDCFWDNNIVLKWSQW